jgi:hypothetical protein
MRNNMLNKNIFIISPIILIILNSCVSAMNGQYFSEDEREKYEVIDNIETEFYAVKGTSKKTLIEMADRRLMEKARKKHNGNIGIRNITIQTSNSPINLLFLLSFSYYYPGYIDVEAKGFVIKEKCSE